MLLVITNCFIDKIAVVFAVVCTYFLRLKFFSAIAMLSLM